MKLIDVKKLLNDNRARVWAADTEEKAWKKKTEAEKSKWIDEFMKFNKKAWEDVYANTVEMENEYLVVKGMVKKAVDELEEMVTLKRTAPGPMTEQERKFIVRHGVDFDDLETLLQRIWTEWDACTPAMKYRGEYCADFVKSGVLTTRHDNAIKELRAKGIDKSAQWNKSGKERVRLLEYPKRWATLKAELEAMHKVAMGQGAEVEKEVAVKLKNFLLAVGQTDALIDKCVETVNAKIGTTMSSLDRKAPSSFLDSLKKSLSEKHQLKREDEDFQHLLALHTNVDLAARALKQAKGKLKTQGIEMKSLRAQVDQQPGLRDKLGKALRPVEQKHEVTDRQLDDLAIALDVARDIVAEHVKSVKG